MSRFYTKNAALDYAERNGTRCLMAREALEDTYEFWCFEDYTAFRKYAIANVEILGLFWHEEILADQPRVPFFDIDLEAGEEFDMDRTGSRIAREFGRECEFIWTDFSRSDKTSFHGICLSEVEDGVYFGFSGSRAQRAFNRSISNRIPGLDVNCVNRLRCVGNAKRRYVDTAPWDLDAFRNGKSSLIGRYEVRVGEESIEAPPLAVGSIDDEVQCALVDFARAKYEYVSWDRNMKIVRLTDLHDCPICRRTHDGTHVYLKLGARNRVFLNCFRAGGRGRFAGIIHEIEDDEEEDVE